MLNIYFPGPPLNWKHGLASVRKLRILYRLTEVRYHLNVKKSKSAFLF